MPPFGPISRRELIRHLRQLGFDGPYAGARHQVMIRGSYSLHIPNPHRGDINRKLLAALLRQSGIAREEWEQLK